MNLPFSEEIDSKYVETEFKTSRLEYGSPRDKLRFIPKLLGLPAGPVSGLLGEQGSRRERPPDCSLGSLHRRVLPGEREIRNGQQINPLHGFEFGQVPASLRRPAGVPCGYLPVSPQNPGGASPHPGPEVPDPELGPRAGLGAESRSQDSGMQPRPDVCPLL
ncbi:hypothetical protein OJ253_2524 [Cryptosporidium canis]|uniref:Uncharacterized protein n=1 Tax=Cryptosporidium canis TaxID=195482 RepID=A0A9D5DH98_9CRYT|nr:hypothetical protein OJ253_2524 [Cryptosporidium canis]